jgi:SAM-dependent methyltransferase
MIQRWLDQLAANPALWGTLRWVAEAGFGADRAVIAHELRPHAPDGPAQVLDFGCGTGEFAACFRPGSYVGCDIAAHYVRYAGRHRTGRYAVMHGAAIGFSTGAFDAGLVLGVFHHLPDAVVQASVAELARVLQPDARLLVLEDIPTRRRWNVAGQLMHWLDRGDHIRSDADYRRLFAPHFVIERSYAIQSGICDLAVYVLRRTNAQDGV